jgi:hypothetical protein
MTPTPSDWNSVPILTKFARLIPSLLVILSSTTLLAQQAIPNGTVIPLRLNSSLKSAKAKPGQAFTATVMQDVPLPGSKIRAGSKLVGHVVSAKKAVNRTGAQLALRFDFVESSKHRVPVSTNLRAIASMLEVEEAQVPIAGPDRGTSQAAWTTNQIGGEVVYRGGGPVANGLQAVGVPTANGVLARVSPVPGTKCSGDVIDHDRLQALWLFSTEACGAYGFPDLAIAHSGRSNPIGEIVLTSTKGDVHLRSGSGMLLLINNSGQSTSIQAQ